MKFLIISFILIGSAIALTCQETPIDQCLDNCDCFKFITKRNDQLIEKCYSHGYHDVINYLDSIMEIQKIGQSACKDQERSKEMEKCDELEMKIHEEKVKWIEISSKIVKQGGTINLLATGLAILSAFFFLVSCIAFNKQ